MINFLMQEDIHTRAVFGAIPGRVGLDLWQGVGYWEFWSYFLVFKIPHLR